MHRSTIWRQQNREKSRQYYREYYQDNREQIIARNASWLNDRPEYKMWHAARQRASRKGLEFDISVEDIIIPKICPYFKTPLKNPSLDRIDNTKGYIKGNVEVISLKANRMKNNATEAELVAFAEHILKDVNAK